MRDSLITALLERTYLGGQTPEQPASAAQVSKVEGQLGFPLSPTLKRILSEVGNGGFGPGYFLMGIDNGFPDDRGETIEKWYLSQRNLGPDDYGWCWPEGLLPFCHWGCGIYSLVDVTKANEPILRFDPNEPSENESYEKCLFSEGYLLRDWLFAWAQGKDLWNLELSK
ncbi:MAG: SMI1/KNR4 family protein [Thermaceae bacterium]|nr:SMI1/KNR4 family protein [Thermaceae bacterium]